MAEPRKDDHLVDSFNDDETRDTEQTRPFVKRPRRAATATRPAARPRHDEAVGRESVEDIDPDRAESDVDRDDSSVDRRVRRWRNDAVTLHELPDRAKIEIQVFGLDAEFRRDIADGLFQPHERAANVLDLCSVSVPPSIRRIACRSSSLRMKSTSVSTSCATERCTSSGFAFQRSGDWSAALRSSCLRSSLSSATSVTVSPPAFATTRPRRGFRLTRCLRYPTGRSLRPYL